MNRDNGVFAQCPVAHALPTRAPLSTSRVRDETARACILRREDNALLEISCVFQAIFERHAYLLPRLRRHLVVTVSLATHRRPPALLRPELHSQ